MTRSTIEDVARLAGVSTATVSRVLSGSPSVSPETRSRVNAAAAELGYRVNAAARALRRDRTSTVGIVVPELANPFFTALVEHLEQRVQGLGLSLHLSSSRNDPVLEAERVRSFLAARVEVLVITPCHVELSTPIVDEARGLVPVIQLDQFADGIQTDWVGIAEDLGMRLVMEHLAAQGVKRVAYVGARPSDSSSRARHQVALRAAQELGMELPDDAALLGTFSAEWGRRAASLIASGGLPQAVACGADVVALGVLEGFDALGIRVPEDVLVTGFDDIPLSSHPRLSITTIRQPIDEIAQAAAAMIGDIVKRGAEHVAQRISLPPELVVRDSSRRR
ncbi:LacI family DNA-binding transcriptional regulator [Dactylosporangium sp. AC04546]|uniref:LacI family DNA-binding transcriptional regulator n=1 Tax=unclassified Dactylosporangium TaxID=2621675 RepID=UPI001EDD0B92|nr:LacI family DNA-binding transcriptional regulator [Dactylosporangium sp. AC04546]WVK89022.1 LacI family DNA-binding transcriptional regulator [Dactylosporangium sp. AC04546]